MTIKRSLILTVLFLTSLSFSQAQTKVAHINSTELMDQLPEVDSIKGKLEKLSAQFQKTLDAIEKELANKQAYWAQNKTQDPEILEIRQQEYDNFVSRYQQKQQEAQQTIAKKQEELLQPILDNVKEVIKQVAKDKGYTYVMDSSEGLGLIYGDPTHDLMAAVKAKLNI